MKFKTSLYYTKSIEYNVNRKIAKICCNYSMPNLQDSVVIDNFDLNIFQFNTDFVNSSLLQFFCQPKQYQNLIFIYYIGGIV